MCKVLYGLIRFAEPYFGPAAVKPRRCQVRIDQQGSVKEGSAIVEISGDIGERESGVTEYSGIVLSQMHSAPG
jgi:hypothetical protein